MHFTSLNLEVSLNLLNISKLTKKMKMEAELTPIRSRVSCSSVWVCSKEDSKSETIKDFLRRIEIGFAFDDSKRT